MQYTQTHTVTHSSEQEDAKRSAYLLGRLASSTRRSFAAIHFIGYFPIASLRALLGSLSPSPSDSPLGTSGYVRDVHPEPECGL